MPKHPEMADISVFPPLSGAPRTPMPNQVVECIAGLIDRGVLPVGTQLPGQEAMCEHWRVGINTIRQAIRALADQGRVLPRPGLPTEVAGGPVGPRVVEARSEAERLHVAAGKGARRRWGRPGWRLLSDSQRQAFTSLELLRLIARQPAEVSDRFVREVVEHGYHAVTQDSGALAPESTEEESTP
jgi:DNA-binding GntR family transcriptional regulator